MSPRMWCGFSLGPRCQMLAFASVVAMLLPAGALAIGTGRSHRADFKLVDARVESGVNTGTSAGVFAGKPFGNGANVQRVTVTAVHGSVATTIQTFTIYTAKAVSTGRGGEPERSTQTGPRRPSAPGGSRAARAHTAEPAVT
jgi:hypothetical protein